MEHKNNRIWGFNDKTLTANLIFLAGLVLLRIILIPQAMLLDDEANYVVWARHLPFGFYDHGPGIAFFIKPFLLIFGENSIGARIGGFAGMGLLSFYLYNFCKRHASPRAGVIAVLFWNIIPVFQGLSVLNTTDTPMMIFLFASVMAFYDGLYYRKKYFYYAGGLIGFALLSKVSTIFIILPLSIILLTNLKKGKYFKELALALLIGAIIYSPFIIYWFQTNFAPIKFMFLRTSLTTDAGWIKDFWLAQFMFLSPLFFILFLYSLCSIPYKMYKKDRTIYFDILSLSAFVIFLYFSFTRRMEANWALAMYSGGFFTVCFLLDRYWDRLWVKGLFTLNTLFCVLLAAVFALQYSRQAIPLNHDPTNRFFYYEAFKTEIKSFYHSSMDPSIPIFGQGYGIPSMFNIYVQPKKEALSFNWESPIKTSYEFWQNERELLGKDLYYLAPHTNIEEVEQHFEEIHYITNFTSFRKGKAVGQFHLYLCKKYTGEK